jgi:hypothetical protein
MSYGSDDTMWVVEGIERIIDVEEKTKGSEFLSMTGTHSAVVTETPTYAQQALQPCDRVETTSPSHK